MTGKLNTKHHILLGEYTLGLLNQPETAQAHSLLGSDESAVATALAWEEQLLALTDLLPPVDPSPLLLQRIQTALGHDTTPAPSSLYRQPDSNTQASDAAASSTSAAASVAPGKPIQTARPEPEPVSSTPAKTNRPIRTEPSFSPENSTATSELADAAAKHTAADSTAAAAGVQSPAPQAAAAQSHSAKPFLRTQQDPVTSQQAPAHTSLWRWRIATLVFALIALALAVIPSEPVPPPINILKVAPTQAAILQAPGQSSTPGWAVTVDTQGNILMKPLVRTDISDDESVQLWTHSAAAPTPRSLGLIDPNQSITVPATLMGHISSDQIFEMTLEPKGGAPTANPSGPVLFIGRMVTFGDLEAAKQAPPESAS